MGAGSTGGDEVAQTEKDKKHMCTPCEGEAGAECVPGPHAMIVDLVHRSTAIS